MDVVSLVGIGLGLGLLICLSFRGWSTLLLAPAAAAVVAGLSREPILAHWTQTFMGAAAVFLAQFFPLFLLGALFGKLMEDSGSLGATASFLTRHLGARHAILAVVLSGALVTYGGVSLFVAFFVLAPLAQNLFRSAAIPRRLMPAAILLGTATFTMSALPGTPAIQNAIPMPFFGTSLFAAPGLGLTASGIMLGFGLWWLGRQARAAAGRGEKFAEGRELARAHVAADERLRERATTAGEFDPAEMVHGSPALTAPGPVIAALPLIVVIAVNMAMSLVILPRLDTAFLAEARWGGASLATIGGIWAVVTALFCAIVMVVALHHRRIPNLRATMDAGVNAAVLPAVSVASLVGFGAVVAAMPGFAMVREAVLGIGGGPVVSLAVAVNALSALTGSASGGLTIALDALGSTFMTRATAISLDPALLHRVAVMAAGTLDTLPHNGAVVTLLAVCGSTHRQSYRDIVVVGIIGPLLALLAVIAIAGSVGVF